MKTRTVFLHMIEITRTHGRGRKRLLVVKPMSVVVQKNAE